MRKIRHLTRREMSLLKRSFLSNGQTRYKPEWSRAYIYISWKSR